MWKLLEERYGGQNVEDAHVIFHFKSAPPLKNASMKELERVLDVIAIQYEYYKKYDPASLQSERSLLFQTAKEKLNLDFSMKFVRHCSRHSYIPNFISLKKFLKAEFLIAQTTEREFHLNRLSKFYDVRSSKFVQDDDDKQIEKDGEYGQNDYSQDADSTQDGIDGLSDDQFAFFIQNTKTGQRIATNDFRQFQNLGQRSYGNKNYDNRGSSHQQGAQRAIGYGGAKGGQSRPTQPTSQFKEGVCSCCKQAHNLLTCPKFKTLKSNLQSVIIRRDKLCYHCLIGQHYAKDCKTDEGKKCGISGCDKYHHKILHRDPKSVNYMNRDIEDECRPSQPTEEELNEAQQLSFKIARDGAISIQTLVCNILSSATTKQRAKNISTIVLIDTGSNMTCIDREFAEKLNLRVIDRKSRTRVHMLNAVVDLPDEIAVEIQLSSSDQTCTKTIVAWTVTNLAKDTTVVDWSEQKKKFAHLKDIPFPKLPEDATIKVILGVDYSALFANHEVVPNPINDNDPMAMKLSLGWTCLGTSEPSDDKNQLLEKDPKKVFKHVLFDLPAKPKKPKTKPE
jgi:hypothetical protein